MYWYIGILVDVTQYALNVSPATVLRSFCSRQVIATREEFGDRLRQFSSFYYGKGYGYESLKQVRTFCMLQTIL
jgi:hypothetical protein